MKSRIEKKERKDSLKIETGNLSLNLNENLEIIPMEITFKENNKPFQNIKSKVNYIIRRIHTKSKESKESKEPKKPKVSKKEITKGPKEMFNEKMNEINEYVIILKKNEHILIIARKYGLLSAMLYNILPLKKLRLKKVENSIDLMRFPEDFAFARYLVEAIEHEKKMIDFHNRRKWDKANL